MCDKRQPSSGWFLSEESGVSCVDARFFAEINGVDVEDVEHHFQALAKKGLAVKVGRTWITGKDPEVVKKVAEKFPEGVLCTRKAKV